MQAAVTALGNGTQLLPRSDDETANAVHDTNDDARRVAAVVAPSTEVSRAQLNTAVARHLLESVRRSTMFLAWSGKTCSISPR
jgi:hypothetical protein